MTQASWETRTVLKISMVTLRTSGHWEWRHSRKWLLYSFNFLIIDLNNFTIQSLTWRKLVGKCCKDLIKWSISTFTCAKISWNGALDFEKPTLGVLAIADALMPLCIPCAQQWLWLPPKSMSLPTGISGAQVQEGTRAANRWECLGFHAPSTALKQRTPYLLLHLSARLLQSMFWVSQTVSTQIKPWLFPLIISSLIQPSLAFLLSLCYLHSCFLGSCWKYLNSS